MWPGEFMSVFIFFFFFWMNYEYLFIYALNDNEVVWIPSKSGISSVSKCWDQIRQKKSTVSWWKIVW